MVNLSPSDMTLILEALIPLPSLKNQEAREARLISASLQPLIPQLELTGPSADVVPNLINFFVQYGRLSLDQESLGRFLSTMKGFVGLDKADKFDDIIRRYNLMVPAVKAPANVIMENPVTPQMVLEKIIGENTLRPIAFLEKALQASRAVACIKVETAAKTWCGTGFMASPNLMFTNQHVLPKPELLATTQVQFNFQLDASGNALQVDLCRPAPHGFYLSNLVLDYAIFELEGEPGDEKRWGCLKVRTDIPELDTHANIIQHPQGLPKQIAMQNNYIKYADEKKIQYLTSTLAGSSGSPVLNDDWEVIGLHHAGGGLLEGDNGPVVFRNEGINLRAILQDLPDDLRKRVAQAG